MDLFVIGTLMPTNIHGSSLLPRSHGIGSKCSDGYIQSHINAGLPTVSNIQFQIIDILTALT
ncbi:hypothetical protein Vdis_1696 [Vulcanisaeta distributa DSM 14429]|uniref:Uncharacterized protein n=1 Tax=Vulcanisaeta distributa (strain DSM 14429 / JCM 11212 / NBRC 100878 / IC-017) TaxID=572478 RepID=E1QU76_VULDI|nr:hypothetical protein Vdis_1696 [Vulcanisaeta distributa DSM 14429]